MSAMPQSLRKTENVILIEKILVIIITGRQNAFTKTSGWGVMWRRQGGQGGGLAEEEELGGGDHNWPLLQYETGNTFHKIVIIQKTEVKWHKNHLLTLRVVVSSLYKMPTVERKFVRSTPNCELWLCEASPSWAGQVLVHCCQVRSFPFFKMFPFHTPSLWVVTRFWILFLSWFSCF